MAGAERLSSTGMEHKDRVKAVMAYFQGHEITVGGQGFIVNYELSGLRSAVVIATEQHRKRVPMLIRRPAWPAIAAQKRLASERLACGAGARGSLGVCAGAERSLRSAMRPEPARARQRRKPLTIAKQIGPFIYQIRERLLQRQRAPRHDRHPLARTVMRVSCLC